MKMAKSRAAALAEFSLTDSNLGILVAVVGKQSTQIEDAEQIHGHFRSQ